MLVRVSDAVLALVFLTDESQVTVLADLLELVRLVDLDDADEALRAHVLCGMVDVRALIVIVADAVHLL